MSSGRFQDCGFYCLFFLEMSKALNFTGKIGLKIVNNEFLITTQYFNLFIKTS